MQYKEMGKYARLEAGSDKYHSDIDASIDSSIGNCEWKVIKYNSGDWEKLVDPTLQVALWLQALEGIPEKYALSFQEAIERYHKYGELELPSLVEDD